MGEACCRAGIGSAAAERSGAARASAGKREGSGGRCTASGRTSARRTATESGEGEGSRVTYRQPCRRTICGTNAQLSTEERAAARTLPPHEVMAEGRRRLLRHLPPIFPRFCVAVSRLPHARLRPVPSEVAAWFISPALSWIEISKGLAKHLGTAGQMVQVTLHFRSFAMFSALTSSHSSSLAPYVPHNFPF